jgi:hypothetical protein
MEEHLRDAIALNTERRPLYSEATEGRSEAVSDALLGHETRLLKAAKVLDQLAEPLRVAGQLEVVCEGVVSMTGAAEFTPSVTPPSEDFALFNGAAAARWARKLHDEGDHAGVASAMDELLEGLEESPSYNCMARHMVESVRRAASRAPGQLHQARLLDFSRPRTRRLEAVINALVGFQIDALEEVALIDEPAAPLQAEGVPMVCGDVPTIPR